jgi:hypothetical protein
MKQFLFLLYFCLCINCTSQKIATNIKGDRILPMEFHLVNRIPTCDESVLYMKSVILPNKVNTKIKSNLDTYHLGEISLNILNDKNEAKINDLHLFYINLDCLKKMSKEELFKLLLNQSDYDLVINLLNSESGRSGRFYFEGEFIGFKCFTLVVNKNLVESFNWCESKYNH